MGLARGIIILGVPMPDGNVPSHDDAVARNVFVALLGHVDVILAQPVPAARPLVSDIDLQVAALGRDKPLSFWPRAANQLEARHAVRLAEVDLDPPVKKPRSTQQE